MIVCCINYINDERSKEIEFCEDDKKAVSVTFSQSLVKEICAENIFFYMKTLAKVWGNSHSQTHEEFINHNKGNHNRRDDGVWMSDLNKHDYIHDTFPLFHLTLHVVLIESIKPSSEIFFLTTCSNTSKMVKKYSTVLWACLALLNLRLFWCLKYYGKNWFYFLFSRTSTTYKFKTVCSVS